MTFTAQFHNRIEILSAKSKRIPIRIDIKLMRSVSEDLPVMALDTERDSNELFNRISIDAKTLELPKNYSKI